jgi:integrase
MTKALTVKRLERIEKEPAPASRQEIPDGLLVGLYLVRQPSKAMSWVVRYRHAGQPRKLTLGSWPAIKLEAARDLGGKALRAAAEGKDPARQKQEAKTEAKRLAADEIRDQRDLFQNVARDFLKRYAKENTRESSWRETARILGFSFHPSPDDGEEFKEAGGDVLDAWKGRKVQEITKRDVITLLDKIADRGATTMANRTLAAIRKLFNWCLSRDVIQVSPCTLLEPPGAERSRDRILADDELKLVWNAADADGWPFGMIIKLMVLTGQREGEIAGMRWNELDVDSKLKLWTLPAGRVKNDELHTVPLSDAVVEIIKALPRIKSTDNHVFANRDGKPPSAFSHAKNRIENAITKANGDKPIPAWVFHDLRRTVASGMAGLGIQLPVIEKVLNHKSGTFRGIVGVYQRHSFADEKRAALAAWASHVERVVSGQTTDKVIELHMQNNLLS